MSTATSEAGRKPRILNNFTMQYEECGAVPRSAMPPLSLGQTVIWYADGRRSSAPRSARCVQINESTIAVIVESFDRFGHTMQGVRHVDDPIFEKDPSASRHEGCWDYADPPVYRQGSGAQDAASAARDLAAVRAELAELRSKFNALDKELHG